MFLNDFEEAHLRDKQRDGLLFDIDKQLILRRRKELFIFIVSLYDAAKKQRWKIFSVKTDFKPPKQQ